MRLTHKGKTATFNKEKIKEMSFEDFDALCRRLPVFKDLPPKEREGKIEKLWHENISKTKKSKKSRPGSGVSGNNKSGHGSASGPEQESAPKGPDLPGSEDNTELSE